MKKRRKKSSGLVFVLPVVGFAILVVVALAVFRPGRPAAKPVPVPAGVLADLTQIPAATWNRAGVTWQQGGSSQHAQPPVLVSAQPAAKPPVMLYVGAEYCPFCAAERWPMIAALSRFGSFKGLQYTSSSPKDVFPSTPTFTFVHATYRSPQLQFQTREIQSNVLQPNGQYAPLQKMTPAQQALVNKYDAPPYVSAKNAGAIPFVLVGGRYLWVGASYSPGLLQGQNWSSVAASLPADKGPAAPAILANGNEIAAAICAVDGGQPGSVCKSAGVEAAARTLPTKPVQ